MSTVKCYIQSFLFQIYRINLLRALTDEGRDILHFEEEIGRVLLQLFPPVLLHEDSGAIYKDFMATILNVIKYNSAYLVNF
jgi:hypothetical protein